MTDRLEYSTTTPHHSNEDMNINITHSELHDDVMMTIELDGLRTILTHGELEELVYISNRYRDARLALSGDR